METSKMEFSKKLFIAVAILNIVVVTFTLVMMWRTCDLSPLGYLIPATMGEMATATGFYYHKAQRENEIKLRQKYGEQLCESTSEGEYR